MVSWQLVVVILISGGYTHTYLFYFFLKSDFVWYMIFVIQQVLSANVSQLTKGPQNSVAFWGGRQSSAWPGSVKELTKMNRGLSMELSRVPEVVSSAQAHGFCRGQKRAYRLGEQLHRKKGGRSALPTTLAPDPLSEA